MKSMMIAVAAAVSLALAGAASAQSGADLEKSKGCGTCHAADTKKMGPAWKDVAAKYKDNKDAANKIVQLAEAIPAEKYAWRPSEGVRTVSEVIGHVSGGNYFLMGMAGAQAPAGTPRNLEQITAKAEALTALRRSIEHVRSSMRAMTAADLDAPATIFGRQSTKRDACLLVVVHAHEHLGQLIAYARSNGITPPWSAQGGQ